MALNFSLLHKMNKQILKLADIVFCSDIMTKKFENTTLTLSLKWLIVMPIILNDKVTEVKDVTLNHVDHRFSDIPVNVI